MRLGVVVMVSVVVVVVRKGVALVLAVLLVVLVGREVICIDFGGKEEGRKDEKKSIPSRVNENSISVNAKKKSTKSQSTNLAILLSLGDRNLA